MPQKFMNDKSSWQDTTSDASAINKAHLQSVTAVTAVKKPFCLVQTSCAACNKSGPLPMAAECTWRCD